MTDSIKITSITISPHAPHTHTVVFLHGRGDNVHSFAHSLNFSCDSRGRTLADSFPSFRWVFPQAPKRQCATSTDIWPQWFDVWNVRNFADHEVLQAVGLKEIVPAIRNILVSEASLLEGRLDRVILAGISMGAATSIHTLFNLDASATQGGRLAAFLGFSCRCPFAGRTLSEMRDVLSLEDVPNDDNVFRDTPVLLEHCIDDPLVLIENGRGLRDILREYGAQVEWKEYPSGGHWFNSPKGMDDAVDFLNVHVLGK
jgi:predicted esterase